MLSRILLTLSAAATLLAQSFDTKMPANVPAVTGKVVENVSMHYIDIAIGTGAPAAPGKQYTVHYTGWLRNGTKFDSSVDRKEPFKFVQGRREVIAGWEVGFEGMKIGGKRRLFIPYQLAYGELGRGSIPPRAELIFDVELLDVADVGAAPPAAADIILWVNDSAEKVIALAKAVPEDKYSWRPAAGVRSFGEVFLHIVYANELQLALAEPNSQEKVKKLVEEMPKKEKQSISKDRIVALLTESFATVRKTLEAAQPATLNREADFFGTKTTRRGVYSGLSKHLGEHLGQAIAYARVNGITPPWSK